MREKRRESGEVVLGWEGECQVVKLALTGMIVLDGEVVVCHDVNCV